MRKFGLGFALLLLIFTSPARAEYVFEFVDPVTGVPTTTFMTTVGSTVDVGVRLRQTMGTELNTRGLVSGGVEVTSSNLGIASVTSTANIFGNVGPAVTQFDAAFPSLVLGQAGLSEVAFPPTPVATSPSNIIFLGFFRFTGNATGTAILTAGNNTNTPGADNVLGPPPPGQSIDAMITGMTATLIVGPAVDVIPEPATIVLFAIGTAGLGFYARRRRNLTVAA